MSLYQRGASLAKTHKMERFDLADGSFVFVKELNSKDFLELEELYPEGNSVKAFDVVCELLSRCICNDDGETLFVNGRDLQAAFPVGLSTIWALRDVVNNLSAPPEKK